jgi:hypothetical protein
LSIDVSGADAVAGFFREIPISLRRDVRETLKRFGVRMQRRAIRLRNLPKITTGETNRSIKGEVGDTGLILRFWIDPSRVTTESGFNRAWGQNDGTYDDYRQGAISPPSDSKSGRRGLVHQDFMGRAWEQELPALEAAMINIAERMG